MERLTDELCVCVWGGGGGVERERDGWVGVEHSRSTDSLFLHLQQCVLILTIPILPTPVSPTVKCQSIPILPTLFFLNRYEWQHLLLLLLLLSSSYSEIIFIIIISCHFKAGKTE